MKVKLDVSPDAEMKVIKDNDDNIISIEFEPFFGKKNGGAVLAYGEVINDNNVCLDRFALSVSGATGKVAKTGRAEPVKAAADELTDDAPKKPATKPAMKPEGS
jgi:hypothetical protein